MAKHVHGDKIEYTSDYIQGDIVKYEVVDKNGIKANTEYAKIIKVKAKLSDESTLMLSFVMDNGRHVEHNQIKEIIRKGW